MHNFTLELTNSHLSVSSLQNPIPKSLQSFDLKKIPWPKSLDLLKELAALGTISWEGKPLLVDFFSKVTFSYEVLKLGSGALQLSGKIHWKKDIDLASCRFIAPCNPPWIIIENQLKVICTDISWLELQKLPRIIDAQELQELIDGSKEENAPSVHLLFEGQWEKDPTPLLVLTDKRGAFANLMMNYEGTLVIFSDPSKKNRNQTAESYWEKDLLETGFIQKIVDKSRYYCPMDKVGKSIAFLLELGWEVQDFLGRKVLLETERQLKCRSTETNIQLNGELQFGAFQADLKGVFGAFNKRDRFIDLGSGFAGLLQENDPLEAIGEEIEAFSSMTLKKNQIGLLEDINPLWEGPSAINFLINHDLTAESPPASFLGTLRPYQQQGLAWLIKLYRAELNGILADEMGLGKTVQVIAFLSLRAIQERHLIVVPTSLLFNWQRELERFLPSIPVYRHHGASRANALPESGIIITSYHTLQNDIAYFQEVLWDSIILDEAQVVKNPDSQIAKSLYRLKSRFRLAMTGTIIENHSSELWAHFHFLMPAFLPDRESFEKQLSLATVDSRYVTKIKKIIHPFILRRKKEEVAKDFPPLEQVVVFIDMLPMQRKAYDNFLASLHQGLLKKVNLEGSSKLRMQIFEALLRLRQIADSPLLVSHLLAEPTEESGKMQALLLDLETIHEEGKKALIFSQFATMLHLIASKLQERGIGYTLLEGATVNREEPVKKFQTDPSISFFLSTLKAGGVGLNLTAADYVLLYDPWWHDAAEAQAIARAHRIGQTKPVIAKRYITADSIEEKMLSLKKAKSALFSQLLEGDAGDMPMLGDEDLISLLI